MARWSRTLNREGVGAHHCGVGVWVERHVVAQFGQCGELFMRRDARAPSPSSTLLRSLLLGFQQHPDHAPVFWFLRGWLRTGSAYGCIMSRARLRRWTPDLSAGWFRELVHLLFHVGPFATEWRNLWNTHFWMSMEVCAMAKCRSSLECWIAECLASERGNVQN